MVERPPPRSLTDAFEDELLEKPMSPLASPLEPAKPPPRPYIRRTRSASSNVDSPESQEAPSLPGALPDSS